MAFNYASHVWKPAAVRATPTNRGAALAWMENLIAFESHSMLEAGITTVSIANQTVQGPKRLIFVGNRIPYNPDACISQITSANYQGIPLDAIYVPDLHFPQAAAFWQSLAAANRGTYTIVEE